MSMCASNIWRVLKIHPFRFDTEPDTTLIRRVNKCMTSPGGGSGGGGGPIAPPAPPPGGPPPPGAPIAPPAPPSAPRPLDAVAAVDPSDPRAMLQSLERRAKELELDAAASALGGDGFSSAAVRAMLHAAQEVEVGSWFTLAHSAHGARSAHDAHSVEVLAKASSAFQTLVYYILRVVRQSATWRASSMRLHIVLMLAASSSALHHSCTESYALLVDANLLIGECCYCDPTRRWG